MNPKEATEIAVKIIRAKANELCDEQGWLLNTKPPTISHSAAVAIRKEIEHLRLVANALNGTPERGVQA